MGAPQIRCFHPADTEAASALRHRTEGIGLSEAASRRAGLGRALVAAALAALAAQISIRKCHAFVFRGNPLGALFRSRAGRERREDLVVHSKPI